MSRTSGEKMRVGRSIDAEASGHLIDAGSHAHGAPAVEWMGEGDRWGQQPDAMGGEVDVREGGGGQQERVHRGADVMTEAGDGQLRRAAAPSGLFSRLVDLDGQAGPGQRERRDETVGSGADDDGVCVPHRSVTVPASSPPRRR